MFCLFTLDGNLSIEICRRILVQCTNIVESNINPTVLARKLYSKKDISEDLYKIVKDNKTRGILVQSILTIFLMI